MKILNWRILLRTTSPAAKPVSRTAPSSFTTSEKKTASAGSMPITPVIAVKCNNWLESRSTIDSCSPQPNANASKSFSSPRAIL